MDPHRVSVWVSKRKKPKALRSCLGITAENSFGSTQYIWKGTVLFVFLLSTKNIVQFSYYTFVILDLTYFCQDEVMLGKTLKTPQ